MRIAIVTVLVAGLVLVFHVLRTEDETQARTGSLTMVGDSLNVGVEPYLADTLPGWRIATDDVVGRVVTMGSPHWSASDPASRPWSWSA